MDTQAPHLPVCSFFFFNDTATTEIYTLSLHDALPIYRKRLEPVWQSNLAFAAGKFWLQWDRDRRTLMMRSEEHTSELQSQSNLVCRLLLEKKQRTWPYNPCSPASA